MDEKLFPNLESTEMLVKKIKELREAIRRHRNLPRESIIDYCNADEELYKLLEDGSPKI